jgi:hypothetical protein
MGKVRKYTTETPGFDGGGGGKMSRKSVGDGRKSIVNWRKRTLASADYRLTTHLLRLGRCYRLYRAFCIYATAF